MHILILISLEIIFDSSIEIEVFSRDIFLIVLIFLITKFGQCDY